MLAWILESAGLEPGFLVGGVPVNFGVSARLGHVAPTLPALRGSLPPEGALAPWGGPAALTPAGEVARSAQVKEEPAQQAGDTEPGAQPPHRPFFVIEADEYDTAFFDKRSKFVHYRPRTAILNNLEFDHADIFDDLAAIERQFHHLVRTVPSSGRVVVNGLEESLTRVLHAGCWSEVRSFGAAVSDFTAEGDPGHFDVLERGIRVATVDWPLGGVHNQLNALAAIAAAEHVGVSPAVAAQALGSFQNVKRRMEVRGTVNGITVYDDFAHHPTAIRTTLDGLRRQIGKSARILAVFEPRSNTMKLGTMKAQLPASLEEANLAFCHSGGLDWDAHAALAPMGDRRPGGRQHRHAGGSGHRRGPARRPHPVHEQRRFRRRARQAAGRDSKPITTNDRLTMGIGFFPIKRRGKSAKPGSPRLARTPPACNWPPASTVRGLARAAQPSRPCAPA